MHVNVKDETDSYMCANCSLAAQFMNKVSI